MTRYDSTFRPRCRARNVLFALLLAAACLPAAVRGEAKKLTIAQVYGAGQSVAGLSGARSYAEHAVITTASYRVSGGDAGFYYNHPVHGPQIRSLLEKDAFVKWGQVDSFMKRQGGRIDHVSLYPEGFVLVQLENPQQVVILPVSLVTVRRSEELIRAYLKLQ